MRIDLHERPFPGIGHVVSLLICATSSMVSLHAQDEGQPPVRRVPDAAPKTVDEPKSRPVKDPTLPSERLKQALKPPEKLAPAAAISAALPEITLKGIVQTKGAEPGAMIEIKGKGVVSVHSGSQLTVIAAAGQSVMLIVTSVGSDQVDIEVPARKEQIGLH